MDWNNIESRPGSFSKNFGWDRYSGLELLHKVINEIFEGRLKAVPRNTAREIIEQRFDGHPLIPLNFFLYNKIIDHDNFVVPDQLVLQAMAEPHTKIFDSLAICALNYSRVGRWKGARSFQSHPAPWARNFVVDVLNRDGRWRPDNANADVIERYLEKHLTHRSDDARKFATNLSFLYQKSNILNIETSRNADWWGAALFLFLDRAIMDEEIRNDASIKTIRKFLDGEKFWALTASNKKHFSYAITDLVEQYRSLGGVHRFDTDIEPETFVGGVRKPNTLEDTDNKFPAILQPKDLSLSPVQRVFAHAQRQVRSQAQIIYLKALYDNKCVICGNYLLVDAMGTPYSEAGHVKPVGRPFEGPDHLSNILLFCPNHHKVFDGGGIWIEQNQGKLLVRSATIDKSFDRNELKLHSDHDFNIDFLKWHAKYFGLS